MIFWIERGLMKYGGFRRIVIVFKFPLGLYIKEN